MAVKGGTERNRGREEWRKEEEGGKEEREGLCPPTVGSKRQKVIRERERDRKSVV